MTVHDKITREQDNTRDNEKFHNVPAEQWAEYWKDESADHGTKNPFMLTHPRDGFNDRGDPVHPGFVPRTNTLNPTPLIFPENHYRQQMPRGSSADAVTRPFPSPLLQAQRPNPFSPTRPFPSQLLNSATGVVGPTGPAGAAENNEDIKNLTSGLSNHGEKIDQLSSSLSKLSSSESLNKFDGSVNINVPEIVAQNDQVKAALEEFNSKMQGIVSEEIRNQLNNGENPFV